MNEPGAIYLFYLDAPNPCYIRDFVWNIPGVVLSFPFVLITCIDSSSGDDLHALFKRFAATQEVPFHATFIPGGIVISCTDFLRFFESDSLLSGFDSVWFFHQIPKFAPMGISLTTETRITKLDDARQDYLSSYMAHHHCGFALGDGVGLNIVARDEQITRWVLSEYPATDITG